MTYAIEWSMYCACGACWRFGRDDAFRPECHGFESPLAANRDLGQVLQLQFACSAPACQLRHSVNCCGRERFWKTHAGRSAIYKWINTIQFNCIKSSMDKDADIGCVSLGEDSSTTFLAKNWPCGQDWFRPVRIYFGSRHDNEMHNGLDVELGWIESPLSQRSYAVCT